jgi:hypothetical protein
MKRLIPVVTAAALLAAVHFCQGRIDAMPEKKELAAMNPFGRMPPAQYMAEYTASMLMGGMRAIAIDYLWIQLGKAEKARNYVEVAAILEILLALQPNFAEIWKHLAWVEAYNIAAQQESEEDRWRWVQKGLEHMDEAVRRDPTSETLAAARGYMLYQRLPQELMLMKRYREWKGADSFGDAAHTLRDAIFLAQSKGRTNTTPPSDGMMQEAYFRYAHILMKRGEFRKSHEVLDEGLEMCLKVSERSANTTENLLANGMFRDLHEPYTLEEELAERIKAGSDVDAVRVRLLELYVKIEKKYMLAKAIEERIVELTDGPVSKAFRLARSGKAADGADLLGKTLIPLYSDLSIRGNNNENPFWVDMVRFVQQIQAALRFEGDKRNAEALKKYDDITEEFLYNLPGTAPQWDLLKEHATQLRGR